MSEEKNKKSKEDVQWDKKKIIFVSVLAFILLIVGYSLISPYLGIDTKKPATRSQVEGLSTQVDFKRNVQDQINSIKNEANNINLEDMASSSPQVQKVIKDLKALQDYPNNQLKEACMKVCSGL